MRKALLFLVAVALFSSCEKQDVEVSELKLLKVELGNTELSLSEPMTENLPVDRPITLVFSGSIDQTQLPGAIQLFDGENAVNISTSLVSENRSVIVHTIGTLKSNTVYRLVISDQLKSANGGSFTGKEVHFKTLMGALQVLSFNIESSKETNSGRIVEVPLDFSISIEFSVPVDKETLQIATKLTGASAPELSFSFADNDKKVTIGSSQPLQYLTKYTFAIENTLKGAGGEDFAGVQRIFYTDVDTTPQFPLISDEELLTKVQEQTFKYFWEFGHENSGLARERNTSGNLVTIGGSGFGVMTLLVGIERRFITRQQGIERLAKIVDFLAIADRFHGVWPHWLDGNTGSVIPFSSKDNGGDLVETAFMIQGLLTAKAYLNENDASEKAIADKITTLWHEVEWDWYTRGGQNVLYWHWSPEFNWEMNLPVRGWDEALIVYVLAAASPTHPIDAAVYHEGWARSGQMTNGKNFYGIEQPLGVDRGGPLFFAHYSFLGLDPRQLSDQYADYWKQNRNHTLINRAYTISNPLGYAGYNESSWGLTASDNHEGYSAHAPNNDKGVITPTAALSSMPYTPEESIHALKHFYYNMGDRLWGPYGFYDAFNITEQWYADSYLAIDQGPIIIMIENYRSGLLWDLFMQNDDVKTGLDKLNFTY
ncbi:MAG: glucoamylase family protein [Cyclobacteriaceae bacterium]